MKRLLGGNRLVLVLLLLPPLLCVMGFTSGAQTDADGALRAASSVAEVDELLSNPTVKSSANYVPAGDYWRVALTEEASQTDIAEVTVADDTGEVEGAKVYPVANTLTYPKTTREEAIKLAAADPEVRQEFTRHAPHTSEADYKDGKWTVHFKVEEGGEVGGMPVDDDTRKEIAQVKVDDNTWQLNEVFTGDQVGWRMARGNYGSYGKQANYPYVWLPLALIFAAAFWRTDKLFSVRNFDILALLGFLVSHGFFRAGDPSPAVLLWYPPLLYLLFRTLLMGFGYGERVERTSNFPTPLLFALGVLGCGLVLGLNLDSRVIDVGYAGVVGGDSILHGTIPYGNMPDDVKTGDTYGPLNYLLYVPFVWLYGWSGEWDTLPAAHALTIFAFIAGTLAMVAAGWRFAGGPRGGAVMLFAWAIFPYTLYSTNNNTNDVLVAAALAIGLATAVSPLARGASVAAGFAIKLFPLILAPLWMLHDDFRKRRALNNLLDFVLGLVGVLLLTFWVLALGGNPIEGASLFLEKTILFQGARETPWTIFTQVPELGFLRQPLTAAVIFLAFLVAVVPKKRTIRRLAAFSAALVIGFELIVNYWFYPYIIWFEPFVFLALLPAFNEKSALDGGGEDAKESRNGKKDDEGGEVEPPDRETASPKPSDRHGEDARRV